MRRSVSSPWVGPALVVTAALLAVLVVRSAGVQLVRITSGSMAPSVGVGDWVLVTRADHARVGDIIEFTFPSGSTARAIKRVAATGGAVVELRDGQLVVDGRPQPIDGEAVRFERRTTVVPAGHYYLLGDNHAGSVDSRSFGPIPSSDVVGTVRHTVPDPRLVLAVLLVALAVVGGRWRRRGEPVPRTFLRGGRGVPGAVGTPARCVQDTR